MSDTGNELSYSVRVKIQEAIAQLKTLSKEAQKAFEIKSSDSGIQKFQDSLKIAKNNVKDLTDELQKKLLSKKTAESVRKQFVDSFDVNGNQKLGILSQIERIKEAANPEELEKFANEAQRIINMRVGSLASEKRTGGAVSGAQEALKAATDVVSAIKDIQSNSFKINDAWTTIASSEKKATDETKSYDETAKKAGQDVEESLENVKSEYEGVSEKAKEAGENAEKSIEQINKTSVDVNADLSSKTLLELVNFIQQVKDEMKDLEKEAKKTAPTQEQNARYNELNTTLNNAKGRLSEVRKEMREVGKDAKTGEDANRTFADSFKSFSNVFTSMSQASGLLGKIKAGIAALGTTSLFAGAEAQQALTMATAGLNLVIEVVTRLLTIIQSIFNALKTLASAIINAFKKVFDAIKKVGEAIKDNIIKLANKAKSSFGDMFSFSGSDMRRTLQMLTKYIFGVRSFFFLYRKLRGAVKDGLENLVQFEGGANETNVAITELRTSLLYLKNAWAAAFAPIINVVYPILVRFMDALAAIGNMIARFVGALTGQATVLQALRVSAGDYAESLASAGGSAKKAADAQEELNDRLAAFDDLNVLGVDDDKDKNKSPSGGGGGADDMPSIDDMFERVNVKMTDLMRQLREAWETGDGFELGQTIADALNRGLEKAHDWLTGEGREKILKIANLIGSTLDGVLSDDELAKNIGQVIADLFSDAMLFINTVITPERMYMVGVRMAEMLNTAIPQILPELGKTIGNLFRSAISNAWGFISTLDFVGLGDALADAINNFFGEMGRLSGKGTLRNPFGEGYTGWQLFGMSVSEFAKGILNFFIEAINEVDWEQVSTAIGDFLGSLDIQGIKDGLNKLWSSIRSAMSDLFSDFSGSNSPFDKSGLGGNASSGSGLSTLFTALYQSIGVLAEHLPQWISSFSAFIDGLPWDKITAWISELPDKFDRLLTTIEGFVDAVTPLLERFGQSLEDSGDDADGWTDKLDRFTDGFSEFSPTITWAAGMGAQTLIDDFASPFAPFLHELPSAVYLVTGSLMAGADALTDATDYVIDGVNEENTLLGNIDQVLVHFPFEYVYTRVSEYFKGANSELKDFSESVKGTADRIKGDFNLDAVAENVKGIVQASNTSLDEIPDKFTAIKGSADTESAGLKDTFSTSFNTIKEESADSAKVIDENFTMAATNIKDTFIEAWNEIKKSISEGGDMFVALSEGMGNSMKALLNGMINGINVSITKPLQDISKSFNILRTLDVNGTRPFAGIPYLNVPTIPRLAQGAVIPPNNQFLAMLGDQKSGTNIEAPLDTIKQAVGEEFAPYADAIVEAVLQVVQAVNNKPVLSDKDIGQANSRYEGRQRIIRGTMI